MNTIFCSPKTGRIYLGTISRNGKQVLTRIDVTDMVLEAVKQYHEYKGESA